MKIFGHPVHIMLIHFPSALFPMDVVCSLLAIYTGKQSFSEAAGYALIAGSVLGWAAVITGTLDLLMVMKKKPAALKTALIHGGINSTLLMVFSTMAYIDYTKGTKFPPDLFIVIIKGILVLLMFFGNYFGGKLILKDKVLDE
ncbi:MAG: DUF2231 domain-containing protein [Bacteroidia bacterium]